VWAECRVLLILKFKFKSRDLVLDSSASCVQAVISADSIPTILQQKLLFRRDVTLQFYALQYYIHNKWRPFFSRRQFLPKRLSNATNQMRPAGLYKLLSGTQHERQPWLKLL